MNRLSRWLTSISINLACLGLFYLGECEGVEWAANIATFWLWFMAIASILIGWIKLPGQPSGPRIPALERTSFVFEVITLIALVAFSHFILATCYLFGMFGRIALRDCIYRIEKAGPRSDGGRGTQLDASCLNQAQDELSGALSGAIVSHEPYCAGTGPAQSCWCQGDASTIGL